MGKKLFINLIITLERLRFHSISLLRKVVAVIGNVAISIIAFAAVTAALYFPESKKALEGFQSIDTILTSLGATFGTILALVLTLSIIPIQRAGEVWSPSIIRLYRKDLLTFFTFIVLGVFCVTSFMLAVKGLTNIPSSFLLAGAVMTLGLSLDLLRWYHSHICQLLDPAHAVGTITKHARKTIDHLQLSVSKVAKLQYRGLATEEKKALSLEDLETRFYLQAPGYPHSINSWIYDVAEIAGKATARGDKYLANLAIDAIREIVNHYLSVRKHNLVFFLAPDAMFLASESDVKVVVDKAYEALVEISRTAIAKGDESIALMVSTAFQDIAVHTENLQARNFATNTAPLTFRPIHHLKSCAKYAQVKGLDEVPIQSAEILSKISLAAPKDVTLKNVHIPVIDGIYEIAVQFYLKKNMTLAEHAIGHMMVVLDHLLNHGDSHYLKLLRHVLQKLEILAPFAVVNEKLQARPRAIVKSCVMKYQAACFNFRSPLIN